MLVFAQTVTYKHHPTKHPTVSHSSVNLSACIYTICISSLFIGMSRFTVQSLIVYGVNLFTMPGMQHVVYTKSLKDLAATSCYLLLLLLKRRTFI